MNKHTRLNLSFDLPGTTGVGARSLFQVALCDRGQYAAGKLELSRPLTV